MKKYNKVYVNYLIYQCISVIVLAEVYLFSSLRFTILPSPTLNNKKKKIYKNV